MQNKIPLVLGLGVTCKSILNFLTKSHGEIYLIEENPDNPSLSDLSNYDTKVHVNPFIGEDFFEIVIPTLISHIALCAGIVGLQTMSSNE